MQGSFLHTMDLKIVMDTGERLSEYLFDNGHNICAVPAVMVDRLRQNATHPEKSDSLDAFGWQRS